MLVNKTHAVVYCLIMLVHSALIN